MKCAVFPCLGLGDGLIAAILSNNLTLAGYEVETFHPLMGDLKEFFPTLTFLPRPGQVPDLKKYDRIYIIYEKLGWMQAVQKEALEQYGEKTVVLNPIATPNRDYPYWENGSFDGNIPFADNLVTYCKVKLGIDSATKSNGIILPSGVESKKHPQRVILHPTSSRAGKNWTQSGFLQLAKRLEKRGFEPVFILTKTEKEEWPEVESPQFENLGAVAKFVAESGYMIGNDSGIGHLASCMGIPTLTICRSQLAANFWRPAWGEGRVVVPPKWIPNLKGLRLRDKKWQKFVPVSRVLNEFRILSDEASCLVGFDK